jgi:hypothetical protein
MIYMCVGLLDVSDITAAALKGSDLTAIKTVSMYLKTNTVGCVTMNIIDYTTTFGLAYIEILYMYLAVIRSRPTAYSKVTIQHNHLNRKKQKNKSKN